MAVGRKRPALEKKKRRQKLNVMRSLGNLMRKVPELMVVDREVVEKVTEVQERLLKV